MRVLSNEENLGFVATVNRGFMESSGDVVLINSDVEVPPRWLENLRLAAYMDPRTATATPLSDNAGAFSVPAIGERNELPAVLGRNEVGRLVMQRSLQTYPRTPTGSGFCMYVKREVLEEVGMLDVERYPRGYGEENDFCMRALKLGWNHVVDDATLVLHERMASFREEKADLLTAGREVTDRIHPEYKRLAGRFVRSDAMGRVAASVRQAYDDVEGRPQDVKPRVLFVIHDGRGGTPHTNEDLMRGLAGDYEPYCLVSDMWQLALYRYTGEGVEAIEAHSLDGQHHPTEFSRPDYRAIVSDLLVRHRFELVHVRHLLGHTFDLPEVADALGIPVVLSFHDFFFSCPTVHLIDDHGNHCGGTCTPGHGQCRLPLERFNDLPVLKHAWLGTWRHQVERMFDHVDAFVTTTEAAKEVYLRSLPVLGERRFEIIEHGRDLEQEHLATPPGDGPIRILVPGGIDAHKGSQVIAAMKALDEEGRLEFHFLGAIAPSLHGIGVYHGRYSREEFARHVAEIAPSFVGVFSIWPETYNHVLTEAWAVGVPVLASDIGALKERVEAHGGGWLIDYTDPARALAQIVAAASEREAYEREVSRATLEGIRSTAEMAGDYRALYEAVVRERRALGASPTIRSLAGSREPGDHARSAQAAGDSPPNAIPR